MTEPSRPRVKYVIGPDGSPLTIADLPPTTTRRWVIRRKAEVVAAVRGGLLSLEEACQRYTLTTEEFLSWQFSIDQHGLAGLRTTRIQHYRTECLSHNSRCAAGPRARTGDGREICEALRDGRLPARSSHRILCPDGDEAGGTRDKVTRHSLRKTAPSPGRGLFAFRIPVPFWGRS